MFIETSSDYLLSSSKEYSIYVAENRGIPQVTDGLKTGQRIALWLLRNRAEKIKTMGLGGQMAAEKLFVHGDVSANNAISLLAAPYKNNVPLIEGLGQFGSRTKPVEGIGAPRYTDVRRSKAAEAFLYNDLDIVPLIDNYDGSNKQPLHFLPLIPTVLLNGVVGVAVGYSTEILPRSLKSLIEATEAALLGKKIKTLVPHFDAYDVDVSSIGENRWAFTGKVVIEDSSTIRITELPPGMPVEGFRSKLIAMEDAGDIVSFVDRSSDKIDISVRFKRGSLKGSPASVEVVEGRKIKVPADPAWDAERAIEFFKLYERKTERIVVIDWAASGMRTYESAEALVTDFAVWRLSWYTKRFEKLLADASYEHIYWRVLRALFDQGFTKKLGTFADKAAVEAEVRKVAEKAKLAVDDKHVDRAVSLPTYRWTKDFAAEIDAKLATLDAAIARYTTTLADPQVLKQVYLDELGALKKLKL